MAEYIEREAFRAELAKGTIITDDIYGMGIMSGMDAAIKKLNSFPAADVVEVVRCSECVWFDKPRGKCTNGVWNDFNDYYHHVREDDFCSYGERGNDA